MIIDKKDVEHIAGLARIKFSDQEKEKMAQEMGAILGYIDKLKEVDTEGVDPVRSLAHAKGVSPEDLDEATSNGVEPISNITGMENVLRKDEPMKKLSRHDGAVDAIKLVEIAPDSKDNFVKVPAVFGE